MTTPNYDFLLHNIREAEKKKEERMKEKRRKEESKFD